MCATYAKPRCRTFVFAIVAYAKPAKKFMGWVTVALQKGLEYFGRLGSEHMRCR